MTDEITSETMLRLAVKRGFCGISKDDLFKCLRGIAYHKLEQLAVELETEGLVTIDWLGQSDFIIVATPKGIELLKNT